MLHSSLLERCIALRKRPLDLKNDEVRDMWLSSLVRRRARRLGCGAPALWHRARTDGPELDRGRVIHA